ncbi:MAG: Ig-like domain repeat protein [Lactobacillales bacterium]|jgi:hypothetical protein|nr:Ig-like domain repeat protein [Lactobacillales bacterium]
MKNWKKFTAVFALCAIAYFTSVHSEEEPLELIVKHELPDSLAKVHSVGVHTNASRIKVGDEFFDTSDLFLEYPKDGKYHLDIIGVDGLRETDKQTLDFEVDNTAPKISVNTDVELTNQTLEFDALIEDANLDSYSVEGIEETGPPLHFKIEKEGKYHLVINAVDKLGNKAKFERDFEIDKTPPTVVLKNNPPEFTNQNVQLDFAADGADTSVTLENYQEQIEFKDKAGNSTWFDVPRFEIDKTPPKITIDNIPELTNKDVNIKYHIDEKNLDTITIDGELNETREGQHKVTIKAVDKAGNVAQKSIEFEIDKTPPTLDFKGIQADEDYRYMPEWELVTDGDEKNYDLKEIQPGHMELAAIAKDKAGNEIKKTINFILNPHGSTFEIDKPNGDYFNKNIQIKIKEKNISKIINKKILIKINNKTKELDTYEFTAEDEGIYQIDVYTTDKAGNKNKLENPVKFVIDKTSPVINLIQTDKGYNLEALDNLSDYTLEYYIDGTRAENLNLTDDDYHFIEIKGRDKSGNEIDKIYEVKKGQKAKEVNKIKQTETKKKPLNKLVLIPIAVVIIAIIIFVGLKV